MKFKQLISSFESDPRSLFVADGIGAGISAFMLGIVLVKFEHFFGIPSPTLYVLAAIPILFIIYDIYCFNKVDNYGPYLRGIAIANLLYCMLSIGLAIYHSEVITIFGWIYIIGEVFIIAIVIGIELRVAKAWDNKTATEQTT